MDRRRAQKAASAAAAGAALLVTAAPAWASKAPAASPPAAQRFLERGVSQDLRTGNSPLVRVRIALVGDPVGETATSPRLRERLGGRLDAVDQRALRLSRAVRARIARQQEDDRQSALEALERPVRRATAAQRSLRRAIERTGGRVLVADPLTNSLVALVPGREVLALGRRADVRVIEREAREKPLVALGLGLSTAVVGAPAVWAAGYTGGTGGADSSLVDLAIINDKIQQDHPAFAGVEFQTPRGRGVASTDDHGAAVASLAISRGASGCSKCVADDIDRKGVAPGLDSVLDAEPLGASASVWALGITQPRPSYGDEIPGAADPAEVMSDSHGSVATEDDSVSLQNLDAYSSTFGTTIARPAGNEGPARTVNSGCIAHNALCMGAYRHVGTQDPTDDVMADFSSRGPSPGGRRKPDLVAIGVTQYAERRWDDPTKGLWAWTMEGTSFAAPQGAGAAALLAGSGLSDPNLQKAVLINSARPGRSAPDQPMGSQIGWQPDWGWGALDLEAALAERTNGAAASVPGGGARFFRATGVAAADRATLVWQRRANGCYEPGCYPSAMTLTNLDLQQLDPSTGTVQAQSASGIDNVEQVRSPGAAATAVYKVKATSTVDGLPEEPFAVTSRRPLTALASPEPAVTVDVSAGAQRPGQTTTVTATVRNPSPDLTAEDASLSLQLPAGVEITSGAQTRTLSTLATASPAQTFTWTVTGTGDGTKSITARAQASRYGETFSGTATDSYLIDGGAPQPTIATPGGTTSEPSLNVAWGATDSHSAIAKFDVEVSTDGGPWTGWLAGTTRTQATHTGMAGRRYRFRVRAIDVLGNSSAWVESTETAVADPPAPLSPPPVAEPPAPVKVKPVLSISKVKRTRRGLALRGKVTPTATGRVTVAYSTKVRGRVARGTSRPTRIKRGRFSASIKLPARARKATRGTLKIRYSGDARHLARWIKRSVVVR